jgi:hypothetical protein
MIAAWYHLAGLPAVDWQAVRTVTLTNVMCVVFVTHLYETVFLIKARASDRWRSSGCGARGPRPRSTPGKPRSIRTSCSTPSTPWGG